MPQRAYATAPITAAQVDPAYLLVGRLDPLLDIARWRSYCDGARSGMGAVARRQAIVVATNPRGYVLGLCVHVVVSHPVQGAVLDAPVFAVASAADEIGVTEALFCDLCTVAERLDCAAIRIRTEGAQRLHRHLEVCDRTARGARRVALILDPRPARASPWA